MNMDHNDSMPINFGISGAAKQLSLVVACVEGNPNSVVKYAL